MTRQTNIAPIPALACIVCLAMPTASAGDSLRDEIETLLPKHVGAAVMVIDKGKVIFAEGFGHADLKRRTPVTPATNFRLASITKQFTAAAILLQCERGELSLDDTLDAFFTETPGYWSRVTVRHLLNHRSGLPDYEDLIPDGATLQLHDPDVLQLLLEADAPLSEPGSEHHYSNSGYVLLGLIVERVTGRPFHGFLREELFEPAGMDATVMYVRDLNEVSHRAFGHRRRNGDWIRDDQSLTSALRGDGAIYSSLNDLAQWIAVLDAKRLLSEQSYLQMYTTTPVEGEDYGYGFGWRIDTYRGEPRVHHNGGTRGFSHAMQRFPERRDAVVVLLNSESPEPMTRVCDRVVDAVLFRDASEAE